MVQVNYGNNMKRGTVIVDSTATPREVLEEVGIDYSRGQTNIDGCVLQIGDFDKTFEELGITSSCNIRTVVKTDNAR